MDQERPFKADHAIQTGGAGRRPTNGAACPPSRVGAREGDHATPGLDPGDGGGGAGRKSDALALPQNRKWRRNPLIKRKTDSEMARRAQTRETPPRPVRPNLAPVTPKPSRGTPPPPPRARLSTGYGDGGGGAGRKSDALAGPQNRKWRRNPLIRLKTDSEMATISRSRGVRALAITRIRQLRRALPGESAGVNPRRLPATELARRNVRRSGIARAACRARGERNARLRRVTLTRAT